MNFMCSSGLIQADSILVQININIIFPYYLKRSYDSIAFEEELGSFRVKVFILYMYFSVILGQYIYKILFILFKCYSAGPLAKEWHICILVCALCIVSKRKWTLVN